MKTQNEYWDRERTLFTQEKQAKRVQEQKLFSALDKIERLKKKKTFEDKQITEEYFTLKKQVNYLQEKLGLLDSLEEEISDKDNTISQLHRKIKLLENELELQKDEADLLK